MQGERRKQSSLDKALRLRSGQAPRNPGREMGSSRISSGLRLPQADEE